MAARKPIKIFNTLSRKKEELKPIKKQVRMYACGPTVYSYAHIGNLRTFLFEDILKRALLYNGYKIKHALNITDVGHLTGDGDGGEDKIEKGARREGKSAREIAKFYTLKFLEDIKALNIILPDKMPRAGAHVKDQIVIIKILEKKGYAYTISDGVYFDTSKFPGYGKLARTDIKGLEVGARVEYNPEKRNATDFALWKFSPHTIDPHTSLPRRQMEWKSPWGTGFPGWHIECSAMSVKYLGQPFDIHCGGIDLVPTHHPNEMAQSEAAFGKPLANYWMHGEHLLIKPESAEKAGNRDGMGSAAKVKRMGKSEGNIITLSELAKKGFHPLSYRYFTLQTHYRKQMHFSLEALQAAQSGLEHLYSMAAEAATGAPAKILVPAVTIPEKAAKKIEQKFLEQLNDDLDMPRAMAIVWKLLKSDLPGKIKLKLLLQFDKVLGLNIKKEIKSRSKSIPKFVQKLAEERNKARARNDWKKSDQIRKAVENAGYSVQDTKNGSVLKKLS